jgi:hypothetical protein
MTGVAGTGSPVAVAGTGQVELVLVVVAVVLGALLLVVRATRSAEARRRRAAGTAYFDRDAARIGPSGRRGDPDRSGTVPPGPSPLHGHNAGRPMAPSFAAPSATRRSRRAPAASSVRPTGTGARPPTRAPMPQWVVPPPPDLHAPVDRMTLRPAAPSMAEPPRLDGIGPPPPAPLAPLPTLRPTGVRPADRPPMPSPPGAAAVAVPDGEVADDG